MPLQSINQSALKFHIKKLIIELLDRKSYNGFLFLFSFCFIFTQINELKLLIYQQQLMNCNLQEKLLLNSPIQEASKTNSGDTAINWVSQSQRFSIFIAIDNPQNDYLFFFLSWKSRI